MGSVELLGVWRSPFSLRVELALKLKGVEYEFIEENHWKKSERLLTSNPVHKKIPVLIHNGKPIAESLVILEYIEETWKENPLLPNDPFERAQVRFWAKFLDEKVLPSAGGALLEQGEMNRKATADLSKYMEVVEKEMIKGKKLLGGGDKIGYLEIVTLSLCYWMSALQEALGREIFTRENSPGIYNWSDELFTQNTIVKQVFPDREKAVASFRDTFAPMLAKQSA